MGENDGKSLVNIKDVFGLEKPLTKLIEVVAKGIGGLAYPWQTRRTADAKAYEIKKLSEEMGEKKGSIVITQNDMKITLENDNISIQSITSLIDKEIKRQINVENILCKCEDILKEKESVTSEPVNEDWITRFFSITQDISNDEMQNLWAKLLADEIEKPKSYSLRTLELIKNLSCDEAKIISRFCKYAFCYKGDVSIVGNIDMLERYGIGPDEFIVLRELNIAEFQSPSIFKRFAIKIDDIGKLQSGNKVLKVINEDKDKSVLITHIPFTTIGTQLYKLIKNVPEMEYFKEVADFIRAESKENKIKINLIDLNNGEIKEL